MADLHITLLSAALAALINIWLAMRCGKARSDAGMVHGDGGNAALIRRMRAQANFVEYTPFALILIFLLELTGHGGWLLALSALAFLLGRICHGLGMDADQAGPLRKIGMFTTLVPLLGWAIAALLAAFRVI
ncbi:hypothetical protein GCM10009127_23930 [Alteraurantiacibacter aestuarii]|uniref:MAPEG family protein n=1 Tax=Alteraurantiacibacter aestuarii TaxID=650004 RepID=UPI0031DA36AB